MLVLVCIERSLRTYRMIQQSGHFAISILPIELMEWADRFAGRYPERSNRFKGIDYLTATTGSPIIPGSLSWVDCELYQLYDGGDHGIFVGRVVDGGVGEAQEPLLYYEARWSQLSAEGPLAGSSWPHEKEPEPLDDG
jgi:flavin reductase (DIM6/NTAB) family NADH-FMN oxidoreductase RutF